MSDAADSFRKDDSNLNDDFKHTSPIPILSSPHYRRRSSTVSSDEAPTTPPDLQTSSTSFPTINPVPASPSSPIFSYFMSSPPKTASFPYRHIPGFGAPAVFEDDEGQEIEAPIPNHQRRATTSWCTSRVSSQKDKAAPAPPVIEAQQARGAGVLRRLSLGSGFGNFIQTNASSPPEPPTPPPTVMTSPVTPGFAANQTASSQRKVRRAATLSVTTSSNARRRAPSPMGERILKGHFDGFN